MCFFGHSQLAASFDKGWGGRCLSPPPQGKIENRRKTKKERKKWTTNNVKLLHVKCRFIQFLNSTVGSRRLYNSGPIVLLRVSLPSSVMQRIMKIEQNYIERSDCMDCLVRGTTQFHVWTLHYAVYCVNMIAICDSANDNNILFIIKLFIITVGLHLI